MMRVLTGLRRQSAWQPYSPLKFEFKKLFSKQQQIQTQKVRGEQKKPEWTKIFKIDSLESSILCLFGECLFQSFHVVAA